MHCLSFKCIVHYHSSLLAFVFLFLRISNQTVHYSTTIKPELIFISYYCNVYTTYFLHPYLQTNYLTKKIKYRHQYFYSVIYAVYMIEVLFTWCHNTTQNSAFKTDKMNAISTLLLFHFTCSAFQLKKKNKQTILSTCLILVILIMIVQTID
jgi:hypothetical protein